MYMYMSVYLYIDIYWFDQSLADKEVWGGGLELSRDPSNNDGCDDDDDDDDDDEDDDDDDRYIGV